MTGVEEQMEIFKLVGGLLRKKTECYVIGGSAMLFYGFKTATKDVDLVFTNEVERKHFIETLKETGFARKSHKTLKHNADEGCILMERKNDRFDLFLTNIITTKFSHGMVARIREKHEFSNLIVNVVSPEDIIALKCATDRAGDRKDAVDIINSRKINWDVILEEAKWQAANGKKAFVVLLFDFVDDLKDNYKVDIPQDFIKELRKEYKNQLIKILGQEKYDELAETERKKKS